MGRKLTGTILGIALLLLAIVLAARGAAPVAAAPLPTTATPKSAHVTLAMSMTGGTTAGDSFNLSAQGEGDLDTARQAARFSYTLQLPADLSAIAPTDGSLTAELILVDGRIYTHDPTTKQWTWLALPSGSASGSFFAPDPAALGSTPPDFVRVGPEQLHGAATTHWHASYDLADLLPVEAASSAQPSAAPLPDMTLEIDYWIGDADSYVHRITMALAFAATDPDDLGGTFGLTLSLTYSNFDQPVQIVAPAGATPASTDDGTGPATGSLLVPQDLPFDTSTFALPSIGGTIAGAFPNAGGALSGQPGAANPSPAAGQGNGGIRLVTPTPTATVRPIPTATRAPSPTAIPPTVARPTATVAIAANAALPPTVAPQAQLATAPTAQEPPPAPAPRSNPLPLILGAAGIIALLGLSGGLILFGRRAQER